MSKYLSTIGLLFLSNAFMTMAWYGHLKFFGKNGHHAALWLIVLFSWGLAFFEYCFQVPANRIGFAENGGPFSLVQLKVIQEVIFLNGRGGLMCPPLLRTNTGIGLTHRSTPTCI